MGRRGPGVSRERIGGRGQSHRTTIFPPAVDAWLFRKAADRDEPIAEVMRRAVEREMIRDPVTTDPDVNEAVAEHLGIDYGLDWAIEQLFAARRQHHGD